MTATEGQGRRYASEVGGRPGWPEAEKPGKGGATEFEGRLAKPVAAGRTEEQRGVELVRKDVSPIIATYQPPIGVRQGCVAKWSNDPPPAS